MPYRTMQFRQEGEAATFIYEEMEMHEVGRGVNWGQDRVLEMYVGLCRNIQSPSQPVSEVPLT